MYLMQTVSTTPRARPAQATEQTATMERTSDIPNLQQVRTSGGEDWSDGGRSPLSPGPGSMYPPPSRPREKEHTEKKKKWSLGGLFRRRKKEIGSESSSQDEEDEAPRKGFLARRRSRREKRKPRTNKSAVTFDHIVVNPLAQTLKPPVRSDRVEEVNGCARDSNGNNVVRAKDLQHVDDASRREIQSGGSVDRLSSRSSRDSYHRHARQDSSLSRNSSGGSGSLEQSVGSRRGRRAVKARVEALRDRQKADSSSEEGEVSASSPSSRFKSDDTLSVSLQREGSLNRRSRMARTERYIKRLSRDEEGIIKREAAELEFQRQQRLCKSDAEGSLNKSLSRNKTVPGANRWAYHEYSDLEHPKMYIRGSSATPSPGHSPLVRHKNIVHYTNSAPACGTVSFDGLTSTFPPNLAMHYATPVTTNSLDRKTPQHNLRPRGPSPLLPSNRSAESIPTVGIPRARINEYRQTKQNYDYGTVGRSERDYIEFQQPGQRSLSFDSNIHRVMPNYTDGPSPIQDPNDIMVVQFPVARLPPTFQQYKTSNMSSGFVAVKQIPAPPPPPRDLQRRLIGQGHDNMRPMSFASDSNQRYQQQDLHLSGDGVIPFTIPQLRHHPSAEIPVTDISWAPNNQRRSNSDNQLATHHIGPHPHSFNPISRPRPSSVTPESMKPMTHSFGGHGTKFVIRTTPSPDTYVTPSNQSVQQRQFQYFADQQPRSRRPIHIQYNTTAAPSSDQPYLSDSQVVLMKPPHQHQEKRHPMQHATEFWRQKDQEGSLKQKKPIPTSPRLQIRQINRSERSRSNSPRPKELPTGLTPSSDSNCRLSKTTKIKVPPLSIPTVRPADSLSSLSGNSDISSPMQISVSSKFSPDISMHGSYEPGGGMDSTRRKENPTTHRPLSMVLENSETPEQSQTPEKVKESPVESISKKEQQLPQPSAKTTPPIPPSRRYSRQSSTSSLEAADWMSEDVGTSEDGKKKKRKSSNLEDALTELEAIYKSLRLGDEDLLDRAERRDLPIPHQLLGNTSPPEKKYPLSSSWGTSRGAESDSGYNYSWGSSSFESLFDGNEPPRRRRAPSLRRSGIPDKVMDDMAYRRLHPKERPGSQDIRNLVSQSGSYLESSPVSAAADGATDDLPQKPLYGPTNQEPDVTLDDVVYRNIRHAKNTLKVLDPQPPFGIPLGPITPAPNSDYLHAVPGDTYRSMFKPRKVPDVVKDDLAYRNLRKDDKDPAFNLSHGTDEVSVLLTPMTKSTINVKNENFSMRKRRAVRSLSANIQSLVNRESLSLVSRDIDQDFEKAQSLSDLPDALQVAQKILEGKEVIGGGSIKIRNLTSSSPVQRSSDQESETRPPESRRYCRSPGTSWVERANLTDIGDRSSIFASTSTETLTDSRANLLQQESSSKRGSWQKKLRVFIPPAGENNDIDSTGDTVYLQRPPPPPTPERISSRLVTESHQRPPPPPTPERSSSRRPSLDQSKILASLAQFPASVVVDRDSPKQISRPTPPHTPGEDSKFVDKRSARNSREIKFGKQSPKADDSLPVPEAVPGSPLDERQLEELLSALAREARATSEKLERELVQLSSDDVPKTLEEQKKPKPPDEPKQKTSSDEKAKSHDVGQRQEENMVKVKEEVKGKFIQNQQSSAKEEVHKYHVELRLEISQPQEKINVQSESFSDIQKDDIETHIEKKYDENQVHKHEEEKNTEEVNVIKTDKAKFTRESPKDEDIISKEKKLTEITSKSPETTERNIFTESETPSQNNESASVPILVLEEAKSLQNEVIPKEKSSSGLMDDSISSSNSAVSLEAINSLSVGEDIPFIDSSDRKSLSKSPLNEDTIKNSSTQSVLHDSLKDDITEQEVCVGKTENKDKCETSHISVNVKPTEQSSPPVAQDSIEDSAKCEVKCSLGVDVGDSKSSEQVSDDFCSCKEEGEDTRGSSPPGADTTSLPARGTPAAGRSGSSICEPCGEHATMYSDRRTKPHALEDLPTSGSSSDGGHRAERVARYKEERRRQLASQYGAREEPVSTPRRYITRSAVKNGDSTDQHAKVRTTKTSRLRAAATSPTEANAQVSKDTSGTTTRNGRDSLTTSPRKDSREISSPVSRSLSVKNSPKRDISNVSLARSQSGKDLPRDSFFRSGLSLSKSQSGKDLVKDMILSPRRQSSRSQSGKDATVLSPRESSGSQSGKELKDGGSPLRSLRSSSRTRRVGVSERRGLNISSGSSDKEKSPAQVSLSDGAVSSTRKEKDKSSKRKSNLNRSLNTEEVVSVDPVEDNSAVRRRRRRVEAHGGNTSLSNLDGGPPTSHSSRSESSPQSDQPPSRAILRLTADSSSHFLQARRLSPPVASSPSTTPTPPNKLKPGTSLRVYSGGAQPDARTDKISQRAERLVSSARDAVARLNKISSESSNICDGSDNREPISGLGESSSSSIDTNKTVNKSDIYRSAEFPVRKSHSQSPERDDLHLKSTDTSSLENDFIEIHPRSRTGSPSKPPSSILKKKSVEEQFPIVTSSSNHQMPVSILKRKTSQDEGGCASGGTSLPPPPVTFSPSVLEQSESKRQGILKKRSSLDESEVLRRRSCSPDMGGWEGGISSEFRPILKNQRRSSMEELVRRTLSPDPQPQSILKRRTSRDDEIEERTSGSPEPQGILKRKSATSSSSSSSSTSPHVSIAASVIMNVAGIVPSSDLLPLDGSSEQVRPILKKKSSSEDNTAADSSSTEAPKPILKKKTSVDVEDLEEKPMKPILKSSRKSSQEEQTSWESASSMESPVRCLILRSRSLGGSDSASGSDCEVVRPILKQPSGDRSSRERSASPRHRLSFCDDQEERAGSAPGSRVPRDESRNVSPSREGVILKRRLKQSALMKDNELSAVLNKRRSLETSVDLEQDAAQIRRSRSPIVVETPRGVPRPMSVAERVLNMESFLVQESSPKQTGAVPKRPGSLRAFRDRERFYTQPITLHELNASSRLESVKAFQKGILDKKSSADSSLVTTPPPSAPDVPPAETPVRESQSVPLASKEKHPSAIPDLSAPGDSIPTVSPPPSPNTEVTMNSHGDDGSKIPEDESDGLLKLCKSNSVVAKASLFAQLEEDMKRAAEEANSRKIPKGSNTGVARYKARREESSSRFATQPVTLGEVQEAVRTTSSSESASTEGKQKGGDDGDDDEPSQLSLAERVKLFNQKIQDDSKSPVMPKQPPPTRKRLGSGSRFKTQPVTTEEVETATQRMSPLAASLAKPPDPKLLGGMSARAARDKMYEHASAILARSSSSSRIVTDKEASVADNTLEQEADVKPKGILKHLRDLESHSTRSPSLTEAAVSSEMDTESESDVRGILKSSGMPITSGAGTPELESFRHLKSVLKKETATSITETQAPESPIMSATNDQLHSILKRESTEWDDSSSSGSESSSESELPSRPLSAPTRNSLDLISILHNVEAKARKERQALMSSPNNKPPRPSSNEEKIMNLRNLRNEKENHQSLKEVTSFERKKIEMDSKSSSENNCVKPSDLCLDHKSLVKQRKLESKLLIEELNRKTIQTHHSMVSEKNHSLNNIRLLDANYVDHKSLVNQKKLESKKLVEELTSRRTAVQTKKTVEEDEASLYERQLRRQIEELQRLSSPNDTPTPPTSDGETSSSGGREVRRIIRNEAVARRRQAALARQQQKEAKNNRSEPGSQQQQLLKKSQSHSSVPSSEHQVPQEEDGFVKGGIKRSYTQPLTEQELRDADDSDAMSGASIAQRLAALQKSGSTDWRKRVSKLNPEDDLTIICSTTHISNQHRYTQIRKILNLNLII